MYAKALVTGGAGFIGAHLARALLARGMAVTVLDDLSMGKESNVPEGATFLRGDVRSRAAVSAALADVDVVFHEAARVSIRASIENFYDDADVNLMGTLNLLQCCAQSRVRKLVFASSMAVYADCATPRPVREDAPTEPISPYGIAKLAAEKYVLRFAELMGIDCAVLRYFNTYGVGQTFTPYVGVITIFIRRLLAGEVPEIFGDGEQMRDFVHVSDVVRANLLAMDAADLGQVVCNVGTGSGRTVNAIAELLCQRIAPSVAPVHRPAHPGELRNSVADLARTADLLGYAPAATIDERIDEVIAFYREGDPGGGLAT